jgi:hypothetical protein
MSEKKLGLILASSGSDRPGEAPESEPIGSREAALDAESHRIVRSVLCRDTTDDREGIARDFTADAWTDRKRLKHAQDRVGNWEQMQAIRRTGVCTDARFWMFAAWCLVLIDAVFWFIASAQAFAF